MLEGDGDGVMGFEGVGGVEQGASMAARCAEPSTRAATTNAPKNLWRLKQPPPSRPLLL